MYVLCACNRNTQGLLFPQNSVNLHYKEICIFTTEVNILVSPSVLASVHCTDVWFFTCHRSRCTVGMWTPSTNGIPSCLQIAAECKHSLTFYCTSILLTGALRYKPKGCGFDFRLCHWNVPLTQSFRPPQECFLGLLSGAWPPLWSSGQSFWLQIQRSRVRSPALPDFLSSSGSGTGSTQPREPRDVNWGATWMKKVAAPGLENRD